MQQPNSRISSTGLLARSLPIILLAGGALMADDVASVPCGPLTLGFDAQTGPWRLLALSADGANLLGADGGMDLQVEAEGHPWPPVAEWKAGPVQVVQTDEGWTVRLTRESAEWQLVSEYRVPRGEPLLRRTATLTWRGAEAVKVYGTAFRVPGVTLNAAPDAAWSLPGNYPSESRRLADSVPGRATRERGWTWSDTGCAYAHSARAGLGLLVNYSLELDHAETRVEEVQGGVSLVTRFDTFGRFQPGDEIEVGTQWVRVVRGDGAAFKQAARDLASRANPGPPSDRPQWLEGAVIEELHPWGRLESWGAGDRGDRMDSLEAQLPYLRDQGVDGLWLLPVSNKPPWVYFLPAFRNLDPKVTTPDQLRSFIAATHGLGMHTLMDLVTYGISPDSPDVASLPEHVWCRDENGERQKAWGGTVLAADLIEPDWNAHIVDLTSWWVREFGADGFRLDCGGSGQSLNWTPRVGRRANATLQSGGIRQNALIRRAIREINPNAVLLPEAGMPSYFRSTDLLFDYPFYMVCREITREAHTEAWVQHAREWLAAQQVTHSVGQQPGLVRFLENHDMVAAQDFWGIGPSQALTALCAFIPGTLLLHQEEEIGFAPKLREWLRLRHELPELRAGDADYLAVKAGDPHVLPVLRFTDEQASIAAINFAPHDSACRLEWPEALAKRLPVCQNAITGEQVANGREISIPAYRPIILTLRKTRRTVPQERPRHAAGDGPLIVERTEQKLDDGTVRHTFRCAPLAGWFVQTSEGLLWDEFVDRRRGTKEGETVADAVPPLWRCWHPLDRGYWDGPGEASLGVIAADGRAVEVRVTDKPAIRAARLDDASAVGQAVGITLDVAPSADAFTVTEHADSAALLKRLALRPRSADHPLVQVDPLWVTVANEHYEAAFSRRHGGTLFDLRAPGGAESLIDGSSEVYTDWGLFEKGLHVAMEWETNPRLTLAPQGDPTEITFTGKLRRPAWNGVHAGYVIEPAVAVRLTYRVDSSSILRVTLGATPATDRPGASAFLAYRIPFTGVDGWQVATGDQILRGKPGEKPSERVFQAGELPDMSDVVMTLQAGDRAVRLASFSGSPRPPQNPFLLDGGAGRMHLFLAMLNGGSVDLKAGEELTASFEVDVR